MTFGDIVTNALHEIQVLGAEETAQPADITLALAKGNRILDNWNAEGLMIFATTLAEFTLQTGHNPHTIGTTGADFTVTTTRPVAIDEANLILTDVTPNIYRPMRIVDDSWWMNNPVPSLATQIPYYLYYNDDWPLGKVYIWPVATVAYGIRLKLRTPLAKFASAADTFSLPPGYEDALTLSLAESLCSAYEKAPSAILLRDAKAARDRIKSLNSAASPTMAVDGAVNSMDQRPQSSIANFLSGFFNS